MIAVQADVAIIGAGFGGSLTALLVERIGLKPVLIEQGSHPRFAIGESSTPLADLALRALAEQYDLPRLVPLTRYGSWRRTYPKVMRGLKRGFSYFRHQAGEPFVPCADHANELLVAANPDDEHADTHWLRADVDHFFIREVQAAGIDYFDRTTLEDIAAGAGEAGLTRSAGWRLSGRREDEAIEVTAPFVIDASGTGRVLERCLGIANDVSNIKTNSRTIYSHFRGVRRWREVHEQAGGQSSDHPYDCDAAALHHVFDGGWMWVLRFDNDLVSAGFVLDRRRSRLNPLRGRFPLDESVPPEREWANWLARFPSIAAQFEQAQPVRPFDRTDRLQRCAAQIIGENWAMLPHTASFLDPLHSSGIALTLSGIERLIAALAAGDRAERLAAYQESLRREIAMLDQIIHGCYQCFDRFELMTSFAMYYFAGAISNEHRRRDGSYNVADGFLMAHDAAFRAAVHSGYDELCDLVSRANGGGVRASEYPSRVAESIGAYNQVGLCDPNKCNMYPYV